MLTNLRLFLNNSRLSRNTSTIREIKVNKQHHREARYLHWIDLLNGSDSDFKSTEEVFDSFSDSNSVLLMKSMK